MREPPGYQLSSVMLPGNDATFSMSVVCVLGGSPCAASGPEAPIHAAKQYAERQQSRCIISVLCRDYKVSTCSSTIQ